MIIAVCALVAVPLVGIVAAIAVPGLLRARMSGNEAAAIGGLRAINSAQTSYATLCGGYAPILPSLGAENFLNSDLTAGKTVTKSGYQFKVVRAAASKTVANPSEQCAGAVTQYVAEAVPVSPGSTGTRFFITDARGMIYQDTSEGFENPTPLQ